MQAKPCNLSFFPFSLLLEANRHARDGVRRWLVSVQPRPPHTDRSNKVGLLSWIGSHKSSAKGHFKISAWTDQLTVLVWEVCYYSSTIHKNSSLSVCLSLSLLLGASISSLSSCMLLLPVWRAARPLSSFLDVGREEVPSKPCNAASEKRESKRNWELRIVTMKVAL